MKIHRHSKFDKEREKAALKRASHRPCSRVGSQVKRVNAAALYLRPGHVRLPDYITPRGNPEHSWLERHLSPTGALRPCPRPSSFDLSSFGAWRLIEALDALELRVIAV